VEVGARSYKKVQNVPLVIERIFGDRQDKRTAYSREGKPIGTFEGLPRCEELTDLYGREGGFYLRVPIDSKGKIMTNYDEAGHRKRVKLTEDFGGGVAILYFEENAVFTDLFARNRGVTINPELDIIVSAQRRLVGSMLLLSSKIASVLFDRFGNCSVRRRTTHGKGKFSETTLLEIIAEAASRRADKRANKRVIIDDKAILKVVGRLLRDKKVVDAQGKWGIHFPFVLDTAVAQTLGVDRNSLINYIRRQQKSPEDYGIIQGTKIVTPQNLSWAVEEVGKVKEARRILPVEVKVTEAAEVLGVSVTPVYALLGKQPREDNYGLAIRTPGRKLERDRCQFKYWVRSLSAEGKRALIALIIYLRDKEKISLSQCYALIHLIRYHRTSLEDNKVIADILGFKSPDTVYTVLQGTKAAKSHKLGALQILENDPQARVILRGKAHQLDRDSLDRVMGIARNRSLELPAFKAELVPKEQKGTRTTKLLSIAQRLAILRAYLSGMSRKEIALDLPQVIGDLSVEPLNSESRVRDFLAGRGDSQGWRGGLEILEEVLTAKSILVDYKLIEQKLCAVSGGLAQEFTSVAEWIVDVRNDAEPQKVFEIVRKLEAKRSPLGRLAESFGEGREVHRFKFSRALREFFLSIAESGKDIGDVEVAKEIARYFSYRVISDFLLGRPRVTAAYRNMIFADQYAVEWRTGEFYDALKRQDEEVPLMQIPLQRAIEFIDSLFNMFRPGRTDYYFSEQEVARFFANVLNQLLWARNTESDSAGYEAGDRAVKLWADAFGRYAERGVGYFPLAQTFIKRVYDSFVHMVYPRIKFLHQEAIDHLKGQKRWSHLCVDRDKYFDFSYIIAQFEARQNRASRLNQLILEFYARYDIGVLKNMYGLDDDEIDEIVTDAAWTYEPDYETEDGKKVEFATHAMGHLAWRSIENYRFLKMKREKAMSMKMIL